MTVTITEHGAGELAWVDLFLSGEAPATVLEVVETGEGHTFKGKIRVRLNAACTSAYKRGEVLTLDAHRVIPRKGYRYTRCGIIRYRTNYRWV